LFDALHVSFGFIEMDQKALLELLVCRLLGHFWKRLHKLLLGVIDVLQLVHEQVVHGLDVSGKESHFSHPFLFWEHTAQAVPSSAGMVDRPHQR
jgi:hypothetical protein